MAFPPSTPQIFALLFLATVAALLAELISRNAPPLGFLGGLILGLLGVWIFANLSWPDISFEPRLEDVPVVRSIVGGVLVVAIFCFVRRRQRA